MLKDRIAFIGTGQMARALAQGVVKSGVCRANQVCGFDPAEAARREFADAVPDAVVTDSLREVIRGSQIVILAMKPHQMPRAADQLKGLLADEHLVVSIAAGVLLSRLGELFSTDRIVRVMPNTPCLVSAGASAYSLGAGATDQDAAVVEQILGAVGIAYQVEENLLDSVTGLSGSGPAYIYMLIEALSDGGVYAGLPRPMAIALAAQTVRGAAEMVLKTGLHPGVLKDQVTSPAGTTIAGVRVLEQRGLRAAAIDAVEAAVARARQMGKE